MTTLRARCFTKLNDLNKPQEDKESNSKEEDYLPAGVIWTYYSYSILGANVGN
jgi:hypothetical protein